MHCPPSLLTNTLNANRHMGGSSLTITYLFNKFAWMIRIKRSTCIAVVGFLLDPVVAPIHLLHKLSGKHPMSAHCAAPSVLHAANAPSQTLSPLAEHPPGVPKHGAAAAHALHGSSLHKLSGKHPMSAHCAAPSVLHAANAPSQTLSPLAEHPPGVPKHGAAAAHALHGPSKAGGAAAAGCSSSAHVSGTQWVGKVSFEMLSTRHGPPVSRSTMNGNLAGFVLRQPTGALP
jgi:hypothetical protein